MLSPSAGPVLFRFALHRGRVRVLALDPMSRPTGAIRRIAALRHDPLQAELAGMMEDEGAIFLVQVLVKPQARRCSRKQARQGCFPAFELLAAQVITVQLNEIEGPHEHAIIVPAVANALKQCDAVLPAPDRLPVDDAGARS